MPRKLRLYANSNHVVFVVVYVKVVHKTKPSDLWKSLLLLNVTRLHRMHEGCPINLLKRCILVNFTCNKIQELKASSNMTFIYWTLSLHSNGNKVGSV